VFALAVFMSAALVFLVEPMAARMVLPRLGGSSAVWNTSLAFFQAALLVGYTYAHLLQRIPSLKAQMLTHLALLAFAALALPPRISDLLGAPSLDRPALWLFGVLTLSIGPPFAVLSATAPLLQAWYGRLQGGADVRDPYNLYAASNLGSLLALIAYPVLVEPLLRLKTQALGWSLGYGLFAVLAILLAVAVWRRPVAAASPSWGAARTRWRDRLIWLCLSAAPTSLLLGVTAHISQDVASAPFLWVVPLALYLLTFVVAFRTPSPIRPALALLLQAAAAPVAAALLIVASTVWLPQLLGHLAAFFLTALICHQALAARRPEASRLTDFYLCLAIGGVIGGAFNAFLAPMIFTAVWEYPLVLGLACLARPWGKGRLRSWEYGLLACAVLTIGLLAAPGLTSTTIKLVSLMVCGGACFLLRSRGLVYAILVLGLGLASYGDQLDGPRQTYRSFFSVIQIRLQPAPTPFSGMIKLMVNGVTLHGAQLQQPTQRCLPTTYYAPGDPIGQAILTAQSVKPTLRMGAVGLGAGTVAAYTRPGDRLRFFEIDPLVARLAFDPAQFSFIRGCARGEVDVTLGDGRLSLGRVPDGAYDLLLIDAFSSDNVPTHLMTVEAIRTYLRVLTPQGVLILHLSNRNLELEGPAAAAVRAAGGTAFIQNYRSQAASPYIESDSQALLAARDPMSLKSYLAAGAWRPPTLKARPWTDDYTNVFGALISRTRHPE
jgi:SAM-dependent methyltransferase